MAFHCINLHIPLAPSTVSALLTTWGRLRTLLKTSGGGARDGVKCFARVNLSPNLTTPSKNFHFQLRARPLFKLKKTRWDQMDAEQESSSQTLWVFFPFGQEKHSAHLEPRWIDESPGTVNQSMSLSILAWVRFLPPCEAIYGKNMASKWAFNIIDLSTCAECKIDAVQCLHVDTSHSGATQQVWCLHVKQSVHTHVYQNQTR